MVDHATGPLLVLAGPGTGKTTTLVESVAARVARGGDPARILVLTFSRKAAVELRDRMALRMGAARAPRATTFHSYCYALVRAEQDSDLFAEPLRLLSGPEQDVAVRELLAGQIELQRQDLAHVSWPDDLRACLTTRGFADEVRAVLARSRELGLGPDALDAFAGRIGRPDWRAAASFLAEYLDVLDLHGVIDYAELVHRAVLLAHRPETARRLAAQYDAVYVDEYQDTDPAQVRLLHALAGGGRTLVAFGDPDQSIYAFRGADVNGILEFPRAFPRLDGRPAPVEVLRTSRRSAAAVLAATRLVTQRMPLTRLPAEKVRVHRDLAPAREGGGVEVYTYPTSGTEIDNIADILRRAHLEDGVPWGEMAVLVRAGSRTIPTVRRALTAAGVPLDIDGDDLPLRHEPAVAPLLTALRAVATAETASGPARPAAPGRRVRGRTARRGAAGPRAVGHSAPTVRRPPTRREQTPSARTHPARTHLRWTHPTLTPPSPTPPTPREPYRTPPAGSTPKPPSPCSPRPSRAWTPPICAASDVPCGTRNGPRATLCRRRRTNCSRAPSPNRSAWPCTTPCTRAVPSGWARC
ncbi:ATP-dependent helicase [Streptomyces sp. Tue 6430]|nr:ATP-dependent helicase [Streptomyces sp. Tue 6430]